MVDICSNSMIQKNYYIGYASDEKLRYEASSGGVGSVLIKYLLQNGYYGTAMTFVFNTDECKYEPKLIYEYEDYNNCGSVYQDTDTIGFIKNSINDIHNGIIVTCMPCQVRAIKSILGRNDVKHFIISLCCSGQTTVQGTWCYYKLLGILKEDVINIQYRGNGWPSGIQIKLKNGDVIKRDNYTYPWTLMHESLLFRPKRCLSCTIKTSPDADVSLADPWLNEYMENDKVGNTVVICNDKGGCVIREMVDKSFLDIKEVNEYTYIESQKGTIHTKSLANRYKRYNKIVAKLGKEGTPYKRIATSSALSLKLHLILLKVLKRCLKK